MAEAERDRRSVALVTGASDGIGAELARLMAARGHRLALLARRRDRLDALADDIAATGHPRPFVTAADLSDPRALAAALDEIARAGLRIEILVNNAGYGLIGSASELDRDGQLGIVDVNVRALTDLTLRLLPDIVEARGRIMLVGSIGSFLPGPYLAVYYASKAYVLSLGEALAKELAETGASVTVLCPGPTVSGFQARAGMAAKSDADPGVMSARDVALAGYEGMMAGRRVVVPGRANRTTALMARLLPRSVLLEMVAKVQKRRKV